MKKILGFLAVAGLMFIATPSQQASAMSLAGPGASTSVGHASIDTTQVHWRGRGWHRGWHRGWRHRHWHRRHW